MGTCKSTFDFMGSCKFYVKVLDIPLTVKMRTGISDKKSAWNAHKLISNLKLWDVSLVTVSAVSYILATHMSIFLTYQHLFFSLWFSLHGRP